MQIGQVLLKKEGIEASPSSTPERVPSRKLVFANLRQKGSKLLEQRTQHLETQLQVLQSRYSQVTERLTL